VNHEDHEEREERFLIFVTFAPFVVLEIVAFGSIRSGRRQLQDIMLRDVDFHGLVLAGTRGG